MPRSRYVPERGDFDWVNLSPRHGHEQAAHRPALVLSPKAYNLKTGLCVICPAARQAKGYAFEVPHRAPEGQQSVILADHIRCIDWRTRRVRFFHRVGIEVLDEVVAKLEALIINPEPV